MKIQQAGNMVNSGTSKELWESRRKEIQWLSTEQDWSQQRIADYYGVSQTLIYRLLIRFGIPSRPKANSGAKNGRYKDGTQSRTYRLMIEKDKCSECGVTEKLAIHHINGDHYDNRLDNLQILCWPCHNSKTKTLYWQQIKDQFGFIPTPRTKDGKFAPRK